ncbi:MAG: hypothetical protein KDD94_13930, partial [Calditrichaeota bacterium]|nr:hypothetical protein [Calditrichota bacterium]
SNQKLEEIDPIHASAKLKKVYAETSDFLEYRWWGKPNDKVPDDQFLTKAEAHTTFAKGRYRIGLTSDDGVILLLDGKEIYRDWTEHEPAHHDLFVDLDGEHHFTVYHFDKSGFATLVFTISAE